MFQDQDKKVKISIFPLVIKVTVTVALPLIILGIAGRLLDRYLNTSPWLFLAGVILSVVVSIVIIYRLMIKRLKN